MGNVNGYRITYLDALQTHDWPSRLPKVNWVLLVFVGEADRPLFDRVTVECMKKRPLGVCCVGPAAHLLEDWFDEEIVTVVLAWEEEHQKPYDYDYAPVTTADTDLDEGFWYAATLAPNMAHAPVETILCLDFTSKHRTRIAELITLLNSGWLPPEPEND